MKLTKRTLITLGLAILMMLCMTVNTFAAETGKGADSGFTPVVQPVVDLLNSLLTPLLAVVGAAGSLYCVFLGIKYIKAEEPQDREKAKSHLKNALIGFVLIFVLMLTLKLLMPVMIRWVQDN